MKTILVDAVDCFIVEQDGKWQVFPQMHELLEKYPNKKIILTGAPQDKWELYGLNNVPYEFFTLSQNPKKIDPNYYKIMLEHFKLRKEEVIYFEHNPEAVKSAQTAGILTYFYDNEKKDLESLKKFLDDNL